MLNNASQTDFFIDDSSELLFIFKYKKLVF
ncbi:hypothetical protein SAMN05216480_1184 [Pustulibacterium marinum]|uniref:Uncharacterized protein n=1 Tax=Pustulibacterium marinum TaxID=1224947 RepID=A0A1I7IMD8_9FLAO|nr:hypothetical protein SAMN05216480_1184 [Pustulibacterium marinum]